MLRLRQKTVIPFFVLLLTTGGLLAAWWFSRAPGSGRDSGQSDRSQRSAVTSQQILSELTALRGKETPREFAAEAGETIRKDQILSADDLNQLASELYQAGFTETAELCCRKSLNQRRLDESATLLLARLLYTTGRISEARTFLTGLLVTGGIDLRSLPMMGNSELEWPSDEQLIQLHGRSMADLTTLLGQASIALRKQDIDLAMSLLNTAEERPAGTSNNRLLQLRAECLSRSGNKAALVELLANASFEFRTSHEEILSLQGKLCRNLGDTQAAIRCFWESFQLNPNSILACSQLAELLEIQNSKEVASQLRERSAAIRDYEDVCRQIHQSNSPTEQQLGFAANAALKLHCLRETYAWCAIAKLVYPDATWQTKQQTQVETIIHPGDQRFSQLYDWIAMQEFSSYPLPDWRQLQSRTSSKRSADTTPIVFRNDTTSSGIEFQFEDAALVGSDTTRLFEFTGGGVAVLDMDLDSWPDLFFTQGGTAPSLGSSEPHVAAEPAASPADQLFRNVRGTSYRTATFAASLVDGGYSQGCTSGDFDMDGFPDLYVANIGQNQLFGNNGDGTFSNVVLPVSETWTTSCAIADVTGDGVPDIYDVNHVIPAGIHQEMCRKSGTSVPCDGGQGLVAEQDRLFAGDGYGGFRDITQQAGIYARDGLGLGLVMLRLENSSGLSIFIANDARPNFLFVNQGNAIQPQFTDEAIVRGVAYSGNGHAQACMGVAAGDADGDRTTDLFITNFFADYNTLYLQRSGFFHDASDSANLVQGSYNKLGFGTQFLDADLDGDLDIVVTNGDVVDFSTENPSRPYAQQPQLFKNHSGGNFEEQSAETSGDAFQAERLGRGLARLDWNADGRPDFVVSHIRSPAMLATNQTTTTGRYLVLHLVGTQSPRHPVGAIVKITTTHGELQSQLTAGDGYMACNENALFLGLGHQEHPVTVAIQWPSGNKQSLPSIPVNSTLVVVESGNSAMTRNSTGFSE